MKEYTRCKHCGCWVNPNLGKHPPGKTQGRKGTQQDPRAPGDWDNICDVCNYGKGLKGGPS